MKKKVLKLKTKGLEDILAAKGLLARHFHYTYYNNQIFSMENQQLKMLKIEQGQYVKGRS